MTHSVLSSLSSSSSLSPSPLAPSTSSCGRCRGSFHHLQAQRLNNKAATCIEIGGGQQYEKAISILVKALRLSEQEQEAQEQEQEADKVAICSCHYCSIDGCIVSNDDDYNTDMNEDNNDGSTIYEKPIFVYEGHNMGSTLIHIIAFNLAIAHHLTAMAKVNNTEQQKNSSIIIDKALQFYELAYECNLTNTCSIRFDMIICNNLSHIYRHQEQNEEQERQQKHDEQSASCYSKTTVHLTNDNTDQQNKKQQQELQLQLQQQMNTDDDDDDDDDDDSSSSNIDLDDLFEVEYYSNEEEEEEYEYNSPLISLITTTMSLSSSLSSTSTTTRSSTTKSYNNNNNNDDLQQNGGSSSLCGYGYSYSSPSSLLLFEHQREGGREDFCLTTSGHDSTRSMCV